ncbi:MAG: aldo/keto reductase [Rubrivivax sp.]|nr:aldo/keto reductase [Rubrivivax sp.]
MTRPARTLPEVELPDGVRWPSLGLGTWRYGESAARRLDEVAALRLALEIGYRVIDTAEMYGEGGAEEVVGEALRQSIAAGTLTRDDVHIVTKVYPHNASPEAMRQACDASRRRLGVDSIDLYLLHWRGGVPLADTLAGFQDLRARGWINRFGVSNFDTADLEELFALPAGTDCAANQVYHSLAERGPEFELIPWQRGRRLPLMAYSPLDQGVLARHTGLSEVAQRLGATPAQVALAALMAQPGVMVIPKSSDPQRLQENWASATLALAPSDLAVLDKAFPPPRRKRALAMR